MNSRLILQARKALSEGRVKKIKVEGLVADSKPAELFVVESRDRKRLYVVVPGVYCSCEDFLFSVFYKEKSKACYHMIAVEIAIKEGISLKKEHMSFDELYKKLLASL
ncbi:SWIM zinc finger family protein [Infirmifilum lucidum]|uniref:SWIM zinc finger family protein n=1 Tax=Infirmifilum lucidum TaxID=2776706 RepID=A0A7L9FL93_9CREN|nr:SWIM zinc finger family protein [Infirmifilum lucidum]QOJ79615.1 SWIM zinc finger family protein [Infirmifilum lucidum]